MDLSLASIRHFCRRPYWKLCVLLIVVTVSVGLLKLAQKTSLHNDNTISINMASKDNNRISWGSKDNNRIDWSSDKYRPRSRVRRLPRALIVGVRKCGTRALWTFLSLHPQIVAPATVTRFFNTDNLYKKGFDYYRQLMPPSYDDQVTKNLIDCDSSQSVLALQLLHLLTG